jgi:Holliday junction resolvase RusA-like endonuclease
MNHYWRHVGSRVLISRQGRQYRQDVAQRVQAGRPLTGRLAVHLQVFPPDKRRRDLDNLQKPLLDALQHAGVYEDDSQIDWLSCERMPASGGRVIATVAESNPWPGSSGEA